MRSTFNWVALVVAGVALLIAAVGAVLALLAGHARFIEVSRSAGDGEFPAPLPAERFFVTTVVDGGPYLKPLNQRRPQLTTARQVQLKTQSWRQPGRQRKQV